MIGPVWKSRATGVGVLVCAAACLAALSTLAIDAVALAQAESRSKTPTTAPAPPSEGWRPPRPVLRTTENPEVALGELFNARLASLLIDLDEVKLVRVRTLSGGLRLAEVTVVGSATPQGMVAFAKWVAINREAIRLKSLSFDQDESLTENSGSFEALVYVVIA